MEYKTLINLKNKFFPRSMSEKTYIKKSPFKYVNILKLGTLFRNKHADSGKCWRLLNYSAKLYSLFFYLY